MRGWRHHRGGSARINSPRELITWSRMRLSGTFRPSWMSLCYRLRLGLKPRRFLVRPAGSSIRWESKKGAATGMGLLARWKIGNRMRSLSHSKKDVGTMAARPMYGGQWIDRHSEVARTIFPKGGKGYMPPSRTILVTDEPVQHEKTKKARAPSRTLRNRGNPST